MPLKVEEGRPYLLQLRFYRNHRSGQKSKENKELYLLGLFWTSDDEKAEHEIMVGNLNRFTLCKELERMMWGSFLCSCPLAGPFWTTRIIQESLLNTGNFATKKYYDNYIFHITQGCG